MFSFDNDESELGRVSQVDTHRVIVDVEVPERLTSANVGSLTALRVTQQSWLIGILETISKRQATGKIEDTRFADGDLEGSSVAVYETNTAGIVLVGTLRERPGGVYEFSRAVDLMPPIETPCRLLSGKNIELFMSVLSHDSGGDNPLEIGVYTLDQAARARLDGNRFFQRHAAILGSTGSGKSWSVGSILEKASKLPSANIVVFDLHGEYNSLPYAKQLHIAGPDDLAGEDGNAIFLPYWLLDSEELQSMFVDRSEFSAHNQVLVFQESVVEGKKKFISSINRPDLLEAFTVNSPIPYDLKNVVKKIKELNEEMIDGKTSKKQGPFHGQFSRLLIRLNSKLDDRRYGFMLQAPVKWHEDGALRELATTLMSFHGVTQGIKVIDFSEVPSDVLPIVIGLVARLIFQLQLWLPSDSRHPVALICDEAHLYLPRHSGLNPVEIRSLENFERIAKEGRKYGVGLVVVSQRPSDVSETILSQCNNFIALRLTNPQDQSVVKQYLPDHMRGMLDLLPILDVGEALVVGDAVLLPTRIKLDPPSEANRPTSETVKFWTDWCSPEKTTDLAAASENYRRQSRSSKS